MSPSETKELGRLETAIENNLAEMWAALKAIHDKRLYRADYPSFEAYLERRWNLGKAHGYRLLKAAEVAENLTSPVGDGVALNERQARVLAPHSPDDQRAAWAAASADGQTPTAERLDAWLSKPPEERAQDINRAEQAVFANRAGGTRALINEAKRHFAAGWRTVDRIPDLDPSRRQRIRSLVQKIEAELKLARGEAVD